MRLARSTRGAAQAGAIFSDIVSDRLPEDDGRGLQRFGHNAEAALTGANCIVRIGPPRLAGLRVSQAWRHPSGKVIRPALTYVSATPSATQKIGPTRCRAKVRGEQTAAADWAASSPNDHFRLCRTVVG
jgi:hypothetical protein